MRNLGNLRLPVTFVVIACLSVALLAGCHAKREVTPPEMFPVGGKVVSAGGQIPAGFQVRFTPEDPELMAIGVIQKDGTFSLNTHYMGVECEGAAAGTYRVMIVAPPTMGGGGIPFILPQPIQISGAATDLTIPFQRQ